MPSLQLVPASNAMKHVLLLVVAVFAVAACQPRGTLCFSTPGRDNPGRYTVEVDGVTKLIVDQDRRGNIETTLESGQKRQYPLPLFVSHGTHRIVVKKNGNVIRDETVRLSHDHPELYFAIATVTPARQEPSGQVESRKRAR
jgi:hypothetical protein